MSSTSSELNPTQFKNTILRAGAGAGKTTTLTQTFLSFADNFKQNSGKFPRIVVTTFTRKATQELKERLLSKALDDHREDLFHYVSSKSQVHISTIHGVLSVFLARYGSSIGLTPDYKILSDSENRKNARKIIRKYIFENSEHQDLLEEYDFQTLENALLHYFNQKNIFSDLNFISSQELENETQIALEKIAKDIKRVAFDIENQSSHAKWQDYAASIRTFNWSANSEDFSQFWGRLNNFWQYLEKPTFQKAKPPFSEELNQELEELRKTLNGFLKKKSNTPEYWQKHEINCTVFQKLSEKFYLDFQKSKIEQGLLSMSDLELLAYKIINESPESAHKFSQEWDFWMVDEYQDTSPIQVEILKKLIGEKPAFVVGDPQQSIYLFRGARSEVFQEKVEEVQNHLGDVQIKLVNYRSTPEVLSFFNYYFTKLSPQFAAMTPDPKKQRSTSKDPVVQVLITHENDEEKKSQESLSVVARIQELLTSGISPEQICVLSRTHKTLEEIAKVGQSFGIPLQLHSGSGFYERREVLDALSILKFLINPHDNANFVALFRTPWFYIDDSELVEFCHAGISSFWSETQKKGHSDQHPFSVISKYRELSEKIGLSCTLKKALIELGVFDYSAQIDNSGRREANLWKVIALLSEEERRPGFNYLDFLDSSLETLSTDEGNEDADATPVVEPKRVNFMTVHASKGLQFDHVILTGMGKSPRASISPFISFEETTGKWTLRVQNSETQSLESSILADKINTEMNSRELEEFNRVLYVALTRAKSGVTLMWDRDFKKKSWAEKCPLDTTEGYFEHEGFSYLVRHENLMPQKMQDEKTDEKEVRALWNSSSVKNGYQKISVTELINEYSEDSQTVEKSTMLVSAEDEVQSLSRAQQGTEAHRIFEALKYFDFQSVEGFSDEKQIEALRFLRDTPLLPLKEIIENGFVEWGFALSHQQNIVQGQIDLWGRVDDVIWVIDYKTGSQKYSEQAFKQLEVYSWALSKMKYLEQIKSVKMAVIYPLDKVIKIKEFNESASEKFENKIEILNSNKVTRGE